MMSNSQCKWQILQNDIGEFTDKTFGKSTTASKMAHLKQEADEVVADPQDILEWADCMILLFDAARREGFSTDELYHGMQKKLGINKKRKWGQAGTDGVVRHVEK